MADERVIDASVVGAAFFNETGSVLARQFLLGGPRLIAPNLLFAEIASLSAKKVWRNEADLNVARRAVATLPDFIDEFVALEPLAIPALDLAAEHRFSAYDALYLALAISRETDVVTLDQKLVDRAGQVGLGPRVTRLT
jgi:predicted nucleic acid-binding protein